MNPLVDEVKEKYSEWLEMAGDNAPALLIDILGQLLSQEKSLTDYYRKRLRSQERKNECRCSTV